MCNQAGDVEVLCDEGCEAAKVLEKEESKEAKTREEQEVLARNQREAELFERRMEGGGKKRRRNRKTETLDDSPSSFSTHKIPIFGVVMVAFLSVAFYWMA